MPRDGSLILSNIRGPTLALVRRGVSPSWALQLDEIDGAAGGDPTLNDLLQTLADGSKARSASVHDDARRGASFDSRLWTICGLRPNSIIAQVEGSLRCW
jgi:hypothetical protein